ncbi:MAG: [Fe-Fe] hydrogenase large subunit C-terminal domain-containing protein [Candidatus Staskawiczbacteria bacterium]|jgi:iron only hydrogenase large subunit-like protein
MKETTPEIKKLFNFIGKKEKMVAMLAPSFLIDFHYPEIIGMLKRLGFKYVAEVSRGAVETNKQLLALLKAHPEGRYITSPCPSVVRLIKNKFPHLVRNLALVDSPMIAMAKIVGKKYPGYKKVYIGPCFAKKNEAEEDHPELDILVLTYKELKEVFKVKKISSTKNDKLLSFDIAAVGTRLYPISGGLAQSSGITKKLTDAEYDVISGPKLVEKILKEFPALPDLKVLDILNCDGGCINGAGIISKDSLESRRKKITSFWEKGR